MSVVLDSSAILALLFNEVRDSAVESFMISANVSAVILAEVVGVCARKGQPEASIRDAIAVFDFKVHELSTDRAWHAGLLLPMTQHLGLSLGDRACISLGIELQLPVMTADKAWANCNIPGLELRLIR